MIKQYPNLSKSKPAPDVSENPSNAWHPSSSFLQIQSYNNYELTIKKTGSWLHKGNLLIDRKKKFMEISLLIAIKNVYVHY